LLSSLKVDFVNSELTIPVGIAIIAYPKIIITLAISWPKGVCGAISPKPTVVIVVTVKYRANKYLDDIESS